MQIKNVRGKTGYIDIGYSLIAVYRATKSEVILIDTGDSHADEIIELLDNNGLKVRAVICTHLHIDHVTNNNAIYKRYGSEFFLYGDDFPYFIRRTNPIYPYHVMDLSPTLKIDENEFEVIHTPGHCPDHLAIVTPDDICFLGDAIITPPLLQTTKLPYIEDVGCAVMTMENIRHMPYPLYIVSHKGVVSKQDISALIDENIQKELEMYDIFRRQITAPISIEDAITNFMLSRKISKKHIYHSEQTRNIVKARILALAEAGELTICGDIILPVHGS